MANSHISFLSYDKPKIILSEFHPFRKIVSLNSMQVSMEDYFDTSIIEGEVAYKNYLQLSKDECVPSCRLRLYNMSENVNVLIGIGFTIKELNEHPSYVNKRIPGEFTIYAIKE